VTVAAGRTRLVIIGAAGRMGTSLMRVLEQFPQLQLHAAIAAGARAVLGRDSGELAGTAPNGVRLSTGLGPALRGAGLALDYSVATASAATVRACATAGVPLLLGTTGLGPEMPAILEAAATQIPLLVAANTSLGVAVLQELVQQAAASLGEDFDIQIQETHHRGKLDSPSGTALALGAAALAGRGPTAAVGYASLRGGDVVGEHEIHFLGPGERLRLAHSATDRSVFARGALRAGCWLVRQGPGRYRMADVLGKK
jgi:4-hydroxy-tetrahydrodipicolinate reductase